MSTVYYNLPSPVSFDDMPAYCVGAFTDKENNIRFIVKRDLSVKLLSFAVSYRFSELPITEKDPENPYITKSYSLPALNEKEYLVIKAKHNGHEINGITAVISSVTLESGEQLSFKAGAYIDADHRTFSGNLLGASPHFLEYIYYKRRYTADGTNDSSAVSSLTKKFENVILEGVEKTDTTHQKNNISARRKIPVSYIVAFSAILVLIITVCILVAGLMRAPTAPSVSSLIEEGEYAAAYKTAMSIRDFDKAQEICREVASLSLADEDYDRAYLYAKAAPNPFDSEIIEDYVTLLLELNKGTEAYDFLADKPEYAETLDFVLRSLIEDFTENNDYKSAFEYAAKAPESLEGYVMQSIGSDIILGGKANDEVFDALKNIYTEAELGEMATEAVDSLMDDRLYTEAAAIASLITDEAVRLSVIKSICETGVPYYIEKHESGNALMLYDFSAEYLDDNTKNDVLEFASDVAERLIETSAVIAFQNRMGKDTSDIFVRKEDESIRSAFESVWFLLTSDQKRSYHSREMDIYKEVFRIEESAVAGVDSAVSVAVSERIIAVLKRDGTAVTAPAEHYSVVNLPTDADCVQIDAGREHVLLLTNDGTVLAFGSNLQGQCNTSEWTDVVKVAAGADFSVALRSDGTLYSTGANTFGQCDIEGISDIIDIAVNDRCTVLLTREGTVMIVGDITMGLLDADQTEGVSRIRAGGSGIVLEKSNGDYTYFCGAKNADEVVTDSWSDLREFAAGSVCVSYIDKNGKMITEGECAPVVHQGYDPNGQ